MQRQHSLPPHRLICDLPTRWNSTLHMVERLVEQRWAVSNYLLEHSARGTQGADLGYFSAEQWQQMRQLCQVLAPFEQATRFVSRDNACLSDVIPLVFLLKRTLDGLLEEGDVPEEEEEESRPRRQAEGAEEEMVPDEEDEGEEDWVPAQHGEQGTCHPTTPAIVRGWEGTEQGQVEPDDLLHLEGSQEEVGRGHLFYMAAHMQTCLRSDPRVCSIKDREDYWVATLLDPRYKGKVGEFLVPSQRERRMGQLRKALCSKLVEAFPQSDTSQASTTPHTQQRRGPSSSSSSKGGDLMGVWKSFFEPQRPAAGPVSTQSHHQQRVEHMVADYMGSVSVQDAIRPDDDPMHYWVSRLDQWPELAQYALEVLACPPASVLSERVFSAAGGVVTEKRTRLSTGSVDKLTFIKMNEAWISGDIQVPIADSRD
ncbi:unnamed protein product [Protopolystoma xenopodis]|uniref:HAT C-terminal dimerisation domain-containing protein n=1 Tax=Protopolystoma xenopodis TaxID=117903 RepID=A0A3S5AP55_9PLAT|nr:unnamed protein product [Protopolystoma xenopodis]